MKEISIKDIATNILNSKNTVQREFLIKGENSEMEKIRGYEYTIPLNWSSIGTQRSYHENPKKIIPYLYSNIFDFGDNSVDKYYINFHTHLMVSNSDLKNFPLVKEGMKRYGTEKFYTLSTYADIDYAVSSVDRNNKLSRIYLKKEIKSKLIGIGICAIQLNGKVSSIGFIDIDALGQDEKALNTVMNFIDTIRAREKKEEKTAVPYLDELLPVLDVINEYTLENQFPIWCNEKSSLTFKDSNLTSFGDVDKIIKIFEYNMSKVFDAQSYGEMCMYGISTNQREKIDTLIKPLKPIIIVPKAWKKLEKITASGVPLLKLFVTDENKTLYFLVDSGSESETEYDFIKNRKALISAEEAILIEDCWEDYLPSILIEEIS